MTEPLRIGCSVGLPSPEVAEIVAGTGLDFTIIEPEHGSIGVREFGHGQG